VVSKNVFAKTVIGVHSLDTQSKKEAEFGFADRHWVDDFESREKVKKAEGGEEDEDSNDNAIEHLQLSFQKNTKVYVLYFTTEPRTA